jgi:hypothetical protein
MPPHLQSVHPLALLVGVVHEIHDAGAAEAATDARECCDASSACTGCYWCGCPAALLRARQCCTRAPGASCLPFRLRVMRDTLAKFV